MKLFTKTFGCQMNFADSDEMADAFEKQGFTLTEDQNTATAVLVNTCTVRQLAEQKATSYIGKLRYWKKQNPERLVIVTGCAAERGKKEMKHRFPYIDLIVGAKDITKFPAELKGLLNTSEKKLVPTVTLGPDVQYVTIMRGCNYNCSYCIVPSVRGREVYIPVEEILANVKSKVAGGAKEIWLLGQTVNSYKPENPPKPGYDFSDLLRDVDAVPGMKKLLFMSPHPHYLTPKLIKAMAECKHVPHQLHLPVQSGSTRVLAQMKRNYTRASYLKGLQLLREAIPDIKITTDIIVGFPTETEEEFQDTLSLVKEANFNSAYCYKYSPRPGTASADTLADDVTLEAKEDRLNRLLQLIAPNSLQKTA